MPPDAAGSPARRGPVQTGCAEKAGAIASEEQREPVTRTHYSSGMPLYRLTCEAVTGPALFPQLMRT